MPFSYGFLDSCQYTNKVGAFYCRWCWALCKYRRTVIALTAVVLLTTAIGGAHANDALYLVFWLRRCNFSFISFPSVLLPAVYGFSIPTAFVYCFGRDFISD